MTFSSRPQTLWSVALGTALALGMGAPAGAQDRGDSGRSSNEQEDNDTGNPRREQAAGEQEARQARRAQ
ncbi:MAG: hypothetical protein ABIO17_01910, partial [Pseudoxanthomonas sp.]